ncbi:MAG: sodium transporter [Halobacteriovoraceae bacterium]|nr:sodium transporter [Halobacteriovoraceae bacterium]|tara:strand:+ start:23944 stop:25839 length:1896 start_codon:yes stop_codon:yes gene_type:complete
MFHWIDATILLAFIFYTVITGFLNKDKAGENLEEYFLAGRSLKGWKAGVSMAATQFAADTPLLVTGLIATSGIFSLWRLWIYALSFLLMGFLLAGAWRRANVLTDAELTEIRYHGNLATALRGIKAIYFGTIFNCTVLAMVLLAATRIAEPFLLWNQWLPVGLFESVQSMVQFVGVPFTINTNNPETLWILSTNNLISILTIVIVTTLYSTTGGLRSVVQTDVLQFFIMMIGTSIYCYFVIKEAGGLASLNQSIQNLDTFALPSGINSKEILAFTPDQAYQVSYGLLGVFGLQWLIQMNSDGTGYLAQRSMACRSEKDAKFAAVLFTFLQVLVRSLLWLPIGLGLLVIFTPEVGSDLSTFTATSEASFIWGIQELLPVGVKGIMITAMLAALASTVDTHLNWGSGYWTNDLYKRIWCEKIKKENAHPRTLVWVARFSNICILFIALFIMAFLDSIQSAWKGSLLIGAAMGVPLLMRWFWWRMNAWGEIASLIVATVSVPFFLIYDGSEFLSLLLIAFLSLTATLIAIFVKGPEDKKILQQFYEKVQPFGFWKAIAADKKNYEIKMGQFKKRLLSLILCALTCFSLLVGLGTLIVQGTTPEFVPSRTIWVAMCLIIGIIVSPYWIKNLRDKK